LKTYNLSIFTDHMLEMRLYRWQWQPSYHLYVSLLDLCKSFHYNAYIEGMLLMVDR
jgi:hypothetical protein